MAEQVKRLVDLLADDLPLNVSEQIKPQGMRNLAQSVHYEITRVDYAELINARIDAVGWSASGANLTVAVATTPSKLVRDSRSFLIVADGAQSVGDWVQAALLDIAPVDDGGELTLRFEYRALTGYSPGDLEIKLFDSLSEINVFPVPAISDGVGVFYATMPHTAAKTTGNAIRFRSTVTTAFEISISATMEVKPNLDKRGQTVTFVDEKAQGTDGGTFPAGTSTRTINKIRNPMGHTWASNPGSNQMVITESGLYNFAIAAIQRSINNGQVKLLRVTPNDGVIARGTNVSCHDTVDSVGIASSIDEPIAVTGGDIYEIHHFAETLRNTDGFGKASNDGFEIYLSCKVTRQTP